MSWLDEVTGIEHEGEALKEPVMHMVVSGHGNAYSIHPSRAAAIAKIRWYWQRKYPEIEFKVQDT